MGKMYTLDGKLLTELPELRIGDKLYPVDNRTCTVKKMMQLTTKKAGEEDEDYLGSMEEALTLALGQKAVAEIKPDELPFPAYQKLFELVLAAATGDDPEKIPNQDNAGRFQPEVK